MEDRTPAIRRRREKEKEGKKEKSPGRSRKELEFEREKGTEEQKKHAGAPNHTFPLIYFR